MRSTGSCDGMILAENGTAPSARMNGRDRLPGMRGIRRKSMDAAYAGKKGLTGIAVLRICPQEATVVFPYGNFHSYTS